MIVLSCKLGKIEKKCRKLGIDKYDGPIIERPNIDFGDVPRAVPAFSKYLDLRIYLNLFSLFKQPARPSMIWFYKLGCITHHPLKPQIDNNQETLDNVFSDYA